MACTATCGSSAQAWTHRSPSERARVEVVAGEVRQPAQRGRLAGGEPEPVPPATRGTATARSRRSWSARTAGSPIASPVSSGRRVVRAGGRAVRAGALALGHPGGGRGPVLQQRDELVAGVGGDVERGEVQPVLGRGDDAGLVLAVEGVDRGPGRGAVPADRDARATPTPPARPTAPRDARARDAQQPVAARTGRAGAAARRGVGRRLGLRGRLGVGTGRRRARSARCFAAQDDRGGELGQGLGQRVDRVGERLDVGLADVGRRA